MEIRKFLFDNLGLKLVSLFLAFLLWLNVSSEQVVDRTVSVPVEFLNMPGNLEISNDYVKTLDVQVNTRRGSLSATNVNMSAVVNLHDAREGERIIPITEADIRKPDGVSIQSISPSRITLTLEKTKSKLVSVEPQLTGKPAPGYQITQVTAFPSEIMVTGPESRVQRATKAVTEAIDVSDAKGPVHREVNVDVADAKLRIDRASPVRVEVLIEEQRASETLTVPLVAGQGLHPAVRSVELQVSYPKTYRRTLKPSMFSVRLEKPEHAKRGQEIELAPQVTMQERPQLIRVDKVIPERVKAKVL
ncbi:MAG TPA: CdaR family protein [Acidobacteriota bacterium]